MKTKLIDDLNVGADYNDKIEELENQILERVISSDVSDNATFLNERAKRLRRGKDLRD